MEKKTSIDFALYRLQRAKEEYENAKLLYKANRFLAANNRAYYSIFYSIRAVLAMEKIDFKRHKDVLAYFNQYYVKTEIFPRQLGRRIVLASKIREDSDYDEEYEPSADDTLMQIETANKLVDKVEKYLDEKRNKQEWNFCKKLCYPKQRIISLV